MQKKIFKVKNMSCSSCVSSIESALEKKGYKSKVNLISEKLVIYTDDDDKKIEDILSKIGYEIKSIKEDEPIKDNKYIKYIILFLGIMSVVVMLDINVYYKLLIATISIIVSRDILIDGYKKTVKFAFNMNSLILIGVISAYIYSIQMVLLDNLDKIYFDGVVVILFVIKLGNSIEKNLKNKAKLSLDSITKLLPSKCNILKDGKVINIEIDDLNKGDILVVKEGEIIASDGIVIKGEASVDESNITGESVDVIKAVDDKVIGSTIIISGQINVMVTEVKEDTLISKISYIMQMTQEIKPNISRFADKVALYFVPTVIMIALVTGISWFIVTKDINTAFNNFAAVILISCPCSIGLATPVSISIGVDLLAKNHILIKNANALENGYKITDIFMDKTGTLTSGKPKVIDFKLDKEYVDDVYSIEKYVNHPISNAIVKYLEKEFEIKEKEVAVRNFQGMGVYSKPYLIGNKKLMDKRNVNTDTYIEEYSKYSHEGKTFIFIAKDNELIGYLTLIDDIKDSTMQFITNIKDTNVNLYMLTGDNANTSKYIANKLGIDKVYAEVLPYEKSEKIEEIKTKDNFIAMVGDGINDAVALTSADISIGINNGVDLAIKASDVVLLRNNLNDIITFKEISKKTMRNIKENLFFGFIYNVFGIVIATGVLGIELTPMIASICMVLSSISVLLNSLRLKLFNRGIYEGN